MSVAKLATQPVATQPTREFIGRAWKNVVAKEGPNKGKEFINVRIDNRFAEITLKPGMSIQLWPNTTREGRQDADYRLSVVEAAA